MMSHRPTAAPLAEDDFAALLAGGDFWSTAEADRAAELVTDSASFRALWRLLSHPDPLVRVRAGDAAEKACRTHQDVIGDASPDRLMNGGPGLGLHATPFAAKLTLGPDQAARLMRRIEDTVLNNPITFIRIEALRSAFALAADNRRLQPRARALAKDAQNGPCQILAARARDLLAGGNGLADAAAA